MFALFSLLLATAAPALATAPLDSNQGQNGDFHVLQLAVPDLETFDREWSVQTPGASISTTSELMRNKMTYSLILFSGCKRDAQGHCRIGVSYRTITPAGTPYPGQDNRKVAAFDGVISDPSQIYLTSAVLGVRIENGEALGKYRIEATTTDEVAGTSVTTWSMLEAVEAK